jgi:pimeloyl-ACP methyl ester carboxylesterase
VFGVLAALSAFSSIATMSAYPYWRAIARAASASPFAWTSGEIVIRHTLLMAQTWPAGREGGRICPSPARSATMAGMTVVFVHGVPETSALWNGVRANLDGDALALDLPGFGTPRPAGFGATKDEYARWLADALRGLDGPVDLVGHDWGAGLVLRVVTAQDVRVRSWAVDVAAVFHRDYVWHDMAQVWQTPGLGEERMAATLAAGPDARGGFLRAAGAPEADAAVIAAAFDETMAGCILDLYRSAVPNPYADWGRELSRPAPAPGLVLQPTGDVYDDPATSGEVAARLGARTARLDGLGHWWMLQDPEAGAEALRSFWRSLRS